MINTISKIMSTRLFFSALFISALVFHSEAIGWSHSHQQPVFDTDGNELQAGQPYYIVSAVWKAGGGGVSPDIRERSHSFNVKQQSSDLNVGTPVSFSPASNSLGERILPISAGERMLQETTGNSDHSGATTIRESTDLNIRFSEMPLVWQVEQSQRSSSPSQTRYVTIGGKPGHPGSSTVRNWFKIERLSRSSPFYRIVYCPSVCESCRRVACGNVGISVSKESEKRWLSVSQHGKFPFVFVKAKRS